MILISRKATLRKGNSLIRYRKRLSNEDMVSRGEPYFLGGPKTGIALVYALGVGSFWKKNGPLLIVGEGLDGIKGDAVDQQRILDARRNGDIWGRWYSKHVPEGEFGFVNYKAVLNLDADEFNSYREKIDAGSERYYQ